jgi:hypothetical protein
MPEEEEGRVEFWLMDWTLLFPSWPHSSPCRRRKRSELSLIDGLKTIYFPQFDRQMYMTVTVLDFWIISDFFFIKKNCFAYNNFVVYAGLICSIEYILKYIMILLFLGRAEIWLYARFLSCDGGSGWSHRHLPCHAACCRSESTLLLLDPIGIYLV